MLWVYDQYKYLNSFSAGTIFIRQNLQTADKDGPHAERVKHDQTFQIY